MKSLILAGLLFLSMRWRVYAATGPSLQVVYRLGLSVHAPIGACSEALNPQVAKNYLFVLPEPASQQRGKKSCIFFVAKEQIKRAVKT